MLEQIDHRGKRFTTGNEDVDDATVACYHRVEALERQTEREIRELERAKAVADPAGESSDVEVLER
ncbi:hypothetical protein [Natronoglomus mannanivorans]|uniref:Uncharacterized protein n=1 Tax=Natronoglomus mannanivorans TaxID=2979990 RepID=A0AAP2Z4A9_9EURY|nr:hypothetical protein [Halobacteria archaeon AArc-xg1-1]